MSKVDNSLKTFDKSGITVEILAKTVDKLKREKVGTWQKLTSCGLSTVFGFYRPFLVFYQPYLKFIDRFT
jgi:hypothetical protein